MNSRNDLQTTMDQNPYSTACPPVDATYFTSEGKNATLRELMRIASPSLGGKMSAVLVKLFRLTQPPQVGFAPYNLERRSPSELSWLQDIYEDDIATLATLGFIPTVGLSIPTIGNAQSNGIAFLGNDPTSFATIDHSETTANGETHLESGLSFVSCSVDTIWGTTTFPKRLNNPPNFKSVYLPGYSPTELHAAHRNRISLIPPNSLRSFSSDVLWNTLKEHETATTTFNVRRGLLRSMTVAEVNALTQSTAKLGG